MKGDREGFSGKHWLQHAAEIDPFMDLLVKEGVRSYLEIGCFMGDTFHAIGSRLEPSSRLVAVEFGLRLIGMPKEAEEIHASLKRVRDDLTAKRREVHVFFGNSRDEAIIEKVTALGPFDAILIDGDHSLRGVTADWNNYGPLGRMVAFHDIVGDNPSSVGPKPLWNELKGQYRHQEFISTGTERGVGVMWR